ncbi:unnamed protein product [Rotaria magnacalcarata]|uniref:Uncharacterized protein n=1 Tax=Rotaria magnacalcarata TaxID=392030 RepID=A0A8S2PLT7_9BILA|nr:unnamed protein product [Rotaria magnacalcarata]
MYGLDIDESAGINVLEALKATNLSCDLHIFVNSTYDTEDNYKALIHDLTQYCSNSESTKVYQVLCRIIFIELEIGCSLLNRSRPLPIKYITSETSTKLCSKNKIIHIDRWIWKKLKLNKKEQMGSDLTKLCTNITSSNETIRLARFFYEIAPSIKRIDSYSSNSISHKILESSTIDRVNLKKREYAKNSDETDQDKIGHENQLLNKNTNDEFQSVKTNSNENLEGNKTEVVLDLKQEQSDSNINKTNSSERARTNLNRDGDDNSSKRFMTSFLAFTLCIIVSYLIITNRNKLLGLLVEGYRRRYAKHGRHFGSNFGPMRLPRLSQTS